MNTIKATVKDGRLELAVPDDWPDGTVVEIQPLGNFGNDDESMTPAEIARTLAAMDRIEPLEMTEAERAAWEAKCRARKDWEKSRFAEHAEKLRGMWE